MTRKYFTNVRSVLNGIMQYAIDKRLLTYNPIANMKLGKDVFCIPDKTCEEDTVFSTVERTSVCKFSMNEAEATGEAKYYAIALLFELPLKDGKLCALTWGNIIKDMKGNSKLVLEQTLEYIRSTNDDLEDSQFSNLLNQASPDNVIPMKTKVG